MEAQDRTAGVEQLSYSKRRMAKTRDDGGHIFFCSQDGLESVRTTVRLMAVRKL